tara:strand:- start:1588 stop:2025 length:438 start_codon:yes stop_codon:yes gene_type:complete
MRNRFLPAALSVAALVLLVLGGQRLPAALLDLPGNVAAEALQAGKSLSPGAVLNVRNTRSRSVRRHATAERWFAVGRAAFEAGDAEKSHAAYAYGLALAPANGVAWAAYARSLAAAGKPGRAGDARTYSVGRAPHDPRAVRLRRD